MKVPIMRGWNGSSKPQNWMTVGSGRKVEAVMPNMDKILAESKGDVEEEWNGWARLLSAEYVDFVRRTKFIFHPCPECSNYI